MAREAQDALAHVPLQDARELHRDDEPSGKGGKFTASSKWENIYRISNCMK